MNRLIAFLAWLLIVLSWILSDGYIHLIATPSQYLRSDLVVVFPDFHKAGISKEASRFRNVSIVDGLSVNDFRVLGLSSSKVVIFVTHGFTDNVTFGLEILRNPPFNEVLLHPLLILTYSMVMGKARVDKGLSLAVTSNIALFMRDLRNKAIIILSCDMVGIDSFSKTLVNHGASTVAYYVGYPNLNDTIVMLNKLLKLIDNKKLNPDVLRSLGFRVYEGRGGYSLIRDLGFGVIALFIHVIISLILILAILRIKRVSTK